MYVNTWQALLLFHIQEVVVDFEAHTISDKDFNGIKKLLQQVCHKFHVLHPNRDVHRAAGLVSLMSRAFRLTTGVPKGSYQYIGDD